MVDDQSKVVFVPPIGPPVRPGDFDGDGTVDREDSDHYYADLDGDLIADFRDVDYGYIPPVNIAFPYYHPDTQTFSRYPPRLGMGDFLQTAGELTYGVLLGTAAFMVPAFAVGMVYGFAKNVIKIGSKAGGS